MNLDQFVGQIVSTGGLDPKSARRAVFATIRALGEVLDPATVRTLHSALPHTMAVMMLANAPPLRSTTFFGRVATHEARSIESATEHAAIVCRALASQLDDDLVRRIADDLGQPHLLEPRWWPHAENPA